MEEQALKAAELFNKANELPPKKEKGKITPKDDKTIPHRRKDVSPKEKGNGADDAISKVEGKTKADNKGRKGRLRVDKKIKSRVDKLAKHQTLEVEAKKFSFSEKTLLKKRIRDFARGYRAGSSETQKRLTTLKTEIAKFARDSLTRAELRKSETTVLLSRVAKAKNPKDLDSSFEKIAEVAEKAYARALRGKLTKELKNTKIRKVKGIPTGRFDADTQEILEKIKDVSQTNRSQALAKIEENVAALEKDPSLEDLIEENEILHFAGIKEMNSSELTEALKSIKLIKEKGRALRKEAAETRKLRMEAIRTNAKETITGGKPPSARAIGLDPHDEKPLADTLRGWDDTAQGWVTLLDKLSRFDRTSKPLRSKLSIFGENVHRARNSKNMMLLDFETQIQKKAEELFTPSKIGAFQSKKGQFKKRLHETFEKKNLGTYKDESGNEVSLKMSEQEALDFHLMSKDPENFKKIQEDNLYTSEMIDAIEDSISPEMLKFGDFMQDLTKQIRDEVTPLYEEIYGVKFPNNPDYWPRSVDVETAKTDALMLIEETKKSSTTPGAIKARVSHRQPLKFEDASFKLQKHIDQMTHFINFAKPMKDIRSVFGNKEIRKSIKEFHGKKAMHQLDNLIDDMASDQATKGDTYTTLDKFRKNFTTSVIGLNLNVFLKQLTSFPAYADEVPLHEFTAGAFDFWTNPVKNFRTLMNSSDLMKARYSLGFERDLKDAAKSTAFQKVSGSKNLVELSMFLVKNGDKFAILNGGWARYKYELKKGLKKGLSEKEAQKKAIFEFEKATKLSQQASDIEDLSKLQRSGSLGKIFTMFQTTPIAYWRQTGVALRAFLNKRGFNAMSEAEANAFRELTEGINIEKNIETITEEMSKGRKGVSGLKKASLQAEYTKRFLIYWVVLPSVFQYVSDGFEYDGTNQLRAAGLGAFNYYPAFGNLVQTASGKLAGERWDFQGSPLLSAMNSLTDLFGSIPKLIQQKAAGEVLKEKSIAAAINDLKTVAGSATGLPFRPATTTLSGAIDLVSGETKDYRRLFRSELSLNEGKSEWEKIRERSYTETITKDDAKTWLKAQKRLLERGEIDQELFEKRKKDFSKRQKLAPEVAKASERSKKILSASEESRLRAYNIYRKKGFTKIHFQKSGLEKVFEEFYKK